MTEASRKSAASIGSQDVLFNRKDILVRFAEEIDAFFGPDNDQNKAKDYLIEKNKKKEPEHFKFYSDTKETYIYDAVDGAIDQFISKGKVPSLPHRRIAVVISDGIDEGSNIQPKDLASKFLRKTNKGVLITVGVGASKNDRRKRYKDLANLASLAGVKNNHSAEGTKSAVVETFVRATAPLKKQLLVEFEVPQYYWERGIKEIALEVRPESGDPRSATIKLDLSSISDQQLEEATTYRKKLAGLVSAKKRKAGPTSTDTGLRTRGRRARRWTRCLWTLLPA